MKKLDSLLRKEVTILGANGVFGKATSLLLKKSSAVKVLNLFDYDKLDTEEDILSTETKCQLKCHFGKEYIGDALKSADIIILSDDLTKGNSFRNHQAQFLEKAPKIVDYASKIAACNSAAVIVVAASPINFTFPLMTAVLDKLGKLDISKVLGMTNVDLIRANSVYASHLQVNPKSVWLPTVGGSSQETRVPLFSKARPSHPLSMRMVQKLTSEIKTFDLQVSGTKSESEMKNRAYATVRLIHAVMAGLEGKKGVVETVMSQQDVVKGAQFFSLPVLLGDTGIQKRISLPQVSDYESRLLAHAVKSLEADANKAMDYVRSSVDIEKLKINSRINKLTDLELNNRIKELNDLDYLKHSTPRTKETCSLSVKNVFSQNAKHTDIESKTGCAEEEKCAREKRPSKEMNQALPKYIPRQEIIQAEISELQGKISSVINTKNFSESFAKISLPNNKNTREHVVQENIGIKNKEIEKTNVKDDSVNTKKDSELFSGKKSTPNLNTSLYEVSNAIKPMIFTECINKNKVQKESITPSTTTNSKETDDSVFSCNEQSTPEKTKGDKEVEKINSTFEDQIEEEIVFDNSEQTERKIEKKEIKKLGRIPPPKPETIEKTIPHSPVIVQDNGFGNEVKTNNSDTLPRSGNDNLKNLHCAKELTKNENQNLAALPETSEVRFFTDKSNELDMSSNFPKYVECNAPVENNENKDRESTLVFGGDGEISKKEETNEFATLNPPQSTENYRLEEDRNGNLEPNSATDCEMTTEKVNEKMPFPYPSDDNQFDTHNKKFNSEPAVSETKSLRDMDFLKRDLKTLDTINDSKCEEINCNTETLKCQDLPFDGKWGFYCSTLPIETFKTIMPCKNILINGQLFKRLKERYAYFPMMETSRFSSSEPLPKEVNGVKNDVNKKKPRPDEIWKFFKEKRNLVPNDNFVTQEGPAATLLKRKNNPLADIKLARELRRVNNDEATLTMKLQEKQKKLITSMKNNNVSFDRETAESPLSVKTKVSNFSKAPGKQIKTSCQKLSQAAYNSVPTDTKGGKTTYQTKETRNMTSTEENITMRKLGDNYRPHLIENGVKLKGNALMVEESRINTEDIKDTEILFNQKKLESTKVTNKNELSLGSKDLSDAEYKKTSERNLKETPVEKRQGTSAENIVINSSLSEPSCNLPPDNNFKIKEHITNDGNSSGMKIISSLPKTSPNINLLDLENLNSSLLQKDQGKRSEEKALVPCNVCPVNCESS